MKKGKRGDFKKEVGKKFEVGLGGIITALLALSLFSEQYNLISKDITSLFLFSFILIKVAGILDRKGTIFEEYLALGILSLFWIVHLTIETQVNSLLTLITLFTLLYLIGAPYWVQQQIQGQNITQFLGSYIIFIVLTILFFAGVYVANDTSFTYENEPTTIQFEDALYFSTITFTGIGYGDFAPTETNKFVASLEGITSIALNIAFFGYILASRRFRRRK